METSWYRLVQVHWENGRLNGERERGERERERERDRETERQRE